MYGSRGLFQLSIIDEGFLRRVWISKVIQLLSFRSRPFDMNSSLDIALEFEFVARDMCAPLRMDYHIFESNGSDLKPKN